MGLSQFIVCCLLPLMVLSQSFSKEPVDTVVMDGNEVIFNCSFNNFENAAKITWYRGASNMYIGNKDVEIFTTQDFQDCCEFAGNRESGDMSIRVKQASFTDQATWKCSYTGPRLLESEATLTVLSEVPYCELTGAGPDNAVIEGTTTATLSCASDGTPPAQLIWTKDGVDTPQAGNSLLEWSPAFERDDADVKYNCKISHPTLKELYTCEEDITFDVQYKPDLRIDVEPKYKDGQIREGEDFYAACVVISSNPPYDTIGWTSLVPDVPDVGTGDAIVLDNIQRNQAGEYLCAAENIYHDGSTGKSEASITLDVQYEPKLELPESTMYIEGDTVSISCEDAITEANPAATEFQWIKDGNVFQMGPALEFDSVSQDNAGTYTCEASNKFYDGNRGKGTGDTTVQVQYNPVVTVPSKVALKVGEMLSIMCEVDAVPQAEGIQWFVPGSEDAQSQSETIEIPNIGKDEGGEYTCRATNAFSDGTSGSGEGKTNVEIQYVGDASIESPSGAVAADVKVIMNCTVDSVPKPSTYEWSQLKKDGSTVILAEKTDMLNLGAVDENNAGNYTCKAVVTFYDQTMETLTATAKLDVRFAPVIIDTPAKIAAFKGEKGVLECRAKGFPDPQFAWYNLTDGKISHVNGSKEIAERTTGDGIYISTLTIININPDVDYGSYKCEAKNELGTVSQMVELAPITKPDAATITTTSATHDTITVKWTAGFNGGLPQTFTVKYKNMDTRDEVGSEDIDEDGRTDEYDYTFYDLEPETKYAAWVIATNSKGKEEVESAAIETDMAPKIDKRSGGGNTGAIIGAVIVVLILVIVGVILVIFILRRRKLKAAQKGDSAVSPKKLDEEEVPLNDTKMEGDKDKGVSEFALDDETGDKKKPEEDPLLKPDEEKKDDEKESPESPPQPDEPPFMKNGKSEEPEGSETEKEDKGTEKEPEAETKIDEPAPENEPEEPKVSEETTEPENKPE